MKYDNPVTEDDYQWKCALQIEIYSCFYHVYFKFTAAEYN